MGVSAFPKMGDRERQFAQVSRVRVKNFAIHPRGTDLAYDVTTWLKLA
jgi:hypothetical protein